MPIVGAFIVPHPPLALPQIGRGQERTIQSTLNAYNEVAQRIAELKPDTLVVTTPHSVMYRDYFHISPGDCAKGDFKSFGIPEVTLTAEYDAELAKSISRIALSQGIYAGFQGERDSNLDHGTMVPLYFINQKLNYYKLVRVSLSGFAPIIHYKFGKCIAQAAASTDKRIVFIASGDLSHKLTQDGPYGFAEQGPEFDSKVTQIMANGNFSDFLEFDDEFCESAAECGLRSFIIMAGALDGKTVEPKLLSYEGPFGVGYAVAQFMINGNDPCRHFDIQYEQSELIRVKSAKANEDEYVKLARLSLEHYITAHERIKRPELLPNELVAKRAGVFVSLKLNGRLRGCIGTIAPVRANIADEIIQNAISAGTQDPRFEPVEEHELPRLVYSVDVLEKSEPISSIEELDVKNYGVIVKSKGKLGLLLPNLEGIETPAQQVDIALQKAGISPNEKYSMERFRVVRHI